MAAVSVDAVDANWRILQIFKEKPLTSRGFSRLVSDGHRRTCYRHSSLIKRNGKPKREGRRMAVIAQHTVCDLRDGLLEFFEPDVEYDDERIVVGYKSCATRYKRQRAKQEREEVAGNRRATLDRVSYAA